MMSISDLQFDLPDKPIPGFIAVEGPIGVGKTTLATQLAHTFNHATLLEQPVENPFLERFYLNPEANALATQLFFLLQRTQQIQSLTHNDLHSPAMVSDYLIDKDQLFAQVTLDDDELAIYQQIFNQLAIQAPQPDLVIYLQAPVEVQHARIRSKGVTAEQSIAVDYLTALNDAYMRFFHFYDQAPLLIVNTAELDLAGNPDHYQQLVEYLLTISSGRHYYNPTPTI